MVALRREFGISATEAYTQMPAWEVDLLIESLKQEHAEMEEQARRDEAAQVRELPHG